MSPLLRAVRAARGMTLVGLVACAAVAHAPAAARGAAGTPAAAATIPEGGARFWFDPGVPLGAPPATALVNDNGSPRILVPRHYADFRRTLAGQLSSWAADPRLSLNPNFVAALLAKESGFDPRATSAVPANGIAQMTHIADADLRIIAREAPAFRWMLPEVEGWPRLPAVHDSAATKAKTDALLASGAVTGKNEYLFEPALALRASMFWLRILATIWMEDQWPGQHGALARDKLGQGGRLPEEELLALVTVSYNQGHPYVADLVTKYGRGWRDHLNEESADYLERIVAYTELFQRAR
ncbi:MAG TPA: transglycosylase SLT domain-containing protein [Gemmatimonadales bacterium]